MDKKEITEFAATCFNYRNNFHLFMENMEERFIIFNKDFQYEQLFPNKEVWHIPTKDIIGKTPYDVLPTEDADTLVKLFKKINNGQPGPYTFYLIMREKDGSKSIFEFIVSRFNTQKFAACWRRFASQPRGSK